MNAANKLEPAEREQRRLMCGRFVGDDFTRLPGISAFGAVLRTARLNAFPRERLNSAYGIRLARRDNVSQLLTFSTSSKDRLAMALGVGAAQRHSWDIESWLPFIGRLDWSCVPWNLRVCPCCARAGFHCLVFQLPWVNRCPWHRCALITRCERCERPLNNAIASGTLLECACGHDYFRVVEACKWDVPHLRAAPAHLANYRDWACEQRATHELVFAAQPQATNWTALAALVVLPSELASIWGTKSPTLNVHRRRITFRTAAAQAETVTTVAHDLPVTVDSVIDLPDALVKPCLAVGYDVADKLPTASLSNGESRGFMMGRSKPKHRNSGASRQSRTELLFLPVQIAGSHGMLDVSSISKAVRQVIQQAATAFGSSSNESAWPAQGAFDSCAATIVARLTRLLLLRAYAEGLRVILARHIAELFDLDRDRPHLTQPSILLERDLVGIRAAILVWTRINPGAHDQLSIQCARRF